MKKLKLAQWARQAALGLPLLVGTLLVSCDTQNVNVFFERYQVAPNTVPTCNSGESSNCLLVREGYKNTDGFGPWKVVSRQRLPNFQYEPGYLYDLTVKLGCGKGGFGIGDGLIVIRQVTVDAKTPSQETYSGSEMLRFGFC